MMTNHIFDFERPIIELEKRLSEMKEIAAASGVALDAAGAELEQKIQDLKINIYQNLSRWQRVQVSRHPERPYSLDYIQQLSPEFIELHGDRAYRDDKAMIGGLGQIEGQSIMFIGQQKGRSTKDRQFRNFGMPNPEGYRKALRLMKLAEKFRIPVISFIDTPGAFPGIEAEERGQGEAIARNLYEMSILQTPVICVIIGEGASGGALGIGIGDRVYMLESTWYSVISPESCSSILWRSWEHKERAAEALKLTSSDNLGLGIIDGVIEEPLGGAHRDPQAAIEAVRRRLLTDLHELRSLSTEELVERRLQKFTQMGVFHEQAPALRASESERAVLR
jgi:acetyl-CoA carboxylase carboxyl transferase subunit alpha